MSMVEDLCKSLVVAAAVVENEAIERDRAGDVPTALKKYEECQGLLARAIAAALPTHPEVHAVFCVPYKSGGHLSVLACSDCGTEQVANDAGPEWVEKCESCFEKTGGMKQMAAVAAVGAVGGAGVLGSTLGCFVTVGAVGGAAAAGMAATRSDKIGDAARGVGSMALKGVDKAREIDREHDITGKMAHAGTKAVETACTINQQYGIMDKVCVVSKKRSKPHAPSECDYREAVA
ncbi:yciC [Symbiodinium sp. CCMP2592]|nr:yciC [Symbiodinium sp. CCMP2592]